MERGLSLPSFLLFLHSTCWRKRAFSLSLLAAPRRVNYAAACVAPGNDQMDLMNDINPRRPPTKQHMAGQSCSLGGSTVCDIASYHIRAFPHNI